MEDTENSVQEPKKPAGKSFKKKILISTLIIVFIIAGAAGVAYTQKVRQLRDKGPMFFLMDRMTKDLNLTEQQKTDVNKIKDEIKAKMESMKKNRTDVMSDFQNAFKQDNLDKKTLEDIEAKREANRTEMKGFFMDELIKFHDILTPDQRAKLVDKMNQMKEQHGKWKHNKDNKPNN
jgi:Spy/CpxP family protein refolding chaperone